MNKEQFTAKMRDHNLMQEELDRKWKAYLVEQEQAEIDRRWKQFLFEKEQSTSRDLNPAAPASSGGGGATVVPSISEQTYIEFFRTDNHDNWMYLQLNVDSGIPTALLDSGVDKSWSVDFYLPPVQKKGYVIIFRNGGDYKFLLIAPDGSILTTIESSTGWDGNLLDGNAIVFFFSVNDTDISFTFFDGENYKTTIYENADSIDLGTEWDYTTADGKFFGAVVYNNGDRSSRLFDASGDVELNYHADGDPITESRWAYTFGNFVVILKYNSNTGHWTRMSIFNTSGTLTADVDLLAMPLNNINFEFYGTDKMQVVFWTDDTADDWQIYNYKGSSENLIYTTESRGLFDQLEVRSNNKYPSYRFSFAPESILNIFYNFDSYSGNFYMSGHLKVAYLFDSDVLYQRYTINDTGVADKGFSFGTEPNSASVSLLSNLGDGYLSNIYFMPNGDINTIQIALLSDISGGGSWYSYDMCGNRVAFYYAKQNDSNNYVFILYQPDGTVIGTLDTPTQAIYQSTSYDSMFIRRYDDGNEQLWYFNNSVSVITETSTHPGFNDETPFYELPNALDSGIFSFFFYNVPSVKILTKTSISDEIALPESNGDANFYLGKQYALYQYQNEDDFIVLNLYDFDLTLLRSATTPYTNIYNTQVIEDRFVTEFYDGGSTRYFYMLTPTATETATVEQVSDEIRSLNDFAWWDD